MNLKKSKQHQCNLQKNNRYTNLNLLMVSFCRLKFIITFFIIKSIVIIVNVENSVMKWKYIIWVHKSNDHVQKIERIASDIYNVRIVVQIVLINVKLIYFNHDLN